MKKIKVFVFLLAFLSISISYSSCKDNAPKTEQQGKEYTSAYICPMHCKDSGSDKEGKCPVCGMDYVKNENFKKKEEEK